jgi:ribosomal protein S18 acetylase RimI-like enzyme
MTKIIYAEERYLQSFHKALDTIARERIYIEMIEAPAFEKTLDFFQKQITGNFPVYYAIENDKVVGWADVTPAANPRLSHRGFLGMGIIESHRGKGLGSQLLTACLDHAKKIGLEKVELAVYSTNTPAIALYKKSGFEQMGYVKNYRKLDGKYFDCLEMEKYVG